MSHGAIALSSVVVGTKRLSLRTARAKSGVVTTTATAGGRKVTTITHASLLPATAYGEWVDRNVAAAVKLPSWLPQSAYQGALRHHLTHPAVASC